MSARKIVNSANWIRLKMICIARKYLQLRQNLSSMCLANYISRPRLFLYWLHKVWKQIFKWQLQKKLASPVLIMLVIWTIAIGKFLLEHSLIFYLQTMTQVIQEEQKTKGIIFVFYWFQADNIHRSYCHWQQGLLDKIIPYKPVSKLDSLIEKEHLTGKEVTTSRQYKKRNCPNFRAGCRELKERWYKKGMKSEMTLCHLKSIYSMVIINAHAASRSSTEYQDFCNYLQFIGFQKQWIFKRRVQIIILNQVICNQFGFEDRFEHKITMVHRACITMSNRFTVVGMDYPILEDTLKSPPCLYATYWSQKLKDLASASSS